MVFASATGGSSSSGVVGLAKEVLSEDYRSIRSEEEGEENTVVVQGKEVSGGSCSRCWW